MGIRGVIAAALLLAISCGGESAPTQFYGLTGTVQDARTSKGIGDAKVTFTSDTLYRVTTTTDDDGRYRMDVESDVPFGQVRASKSGYVAAEETVYFDTASRRMDLELRPEPPPSE